MQNFSGFPSTLTYHTRRAFVTRLSLSTTTPRSGLEYVTLDRGLLNEEGDELFEASAFVTPLSVIAEVTELAPAPTTPEEPRSAVIAGSLE